MSQLSQQLALSLTHINPVAVEQPTGPRLIASGEYEYVWKRLERWLSGFGPFCLHSFAPNPFLDVRVATSGARQPTRKVWATGRRTQDLLVVLHAGFVEGVPVSWHLGMGRKSWETKERSWKIQWFKAMVFPCFPHLKLQSMVFSRTFLDKPIWNISSLARADQVKVRIVVEHFLLKELKTGGVSKLASMHKLRIQIFAEQRFHFLSGRTQHTHPGAASLGCSSHRLRLFTATFSKPEVHWFLWS